MINDQVRQITQYRALLGQLIEQVAETVETVENGNGYREISLAIIKLQEAEHWLQDASAAIKRRENAQIEP